MRPAERAGAPAADEVADAERQPGPPTWVSTSPSSPRRELGHAQLLVVEEPGLLEPVREGIVPDVVQQGGQAGGEPVLFGDRLEFPALGERGQRRLGEVIRAEGVLEAGVGGAGIDEEGVAELAHVAKALDGGRIEHAQRRTVQPDVVPQRVANDLEAVRQRRAPPRRRRDRRRPRRLRSSRGTCRRAWRAWAS